MTPVSPPLDSALAYERVRNSPTRPSTWRWVFAGQVIGAIDTQQFDRIDPILARTIKFRRRLTRCHTPKGLKRLLGDDFALYTAWEAFELRIPKPEQVAADVKAGKSLAEIGQRHWLPEEVVRVYVPVFIDPGPGLERGDAQPSRLFTLTDGNFTPFYFGTSNDNKTLTS